MSRQRRNAITDQFVPHTRKMLESPAYRVLSRAALQVLARIEIEHMSHGGKENGNLPVTYDDFEKYGIHRHSIAPAIRELVALGFIKVTEHGCAGNREFRSPNKFELTYCAAKHSYGISTHEWRWVESLEQAHALAKQARSAVSEIVNSPKKNKHTKLHTLQNPSYGKSQSPVTNLDTNGHPFSRTETATSAQ
jgi:hypothetical protein